MKAFSFVFLFVGLLGGSLSGCVGGTLSNHNDIEEYPLRGATDSEAKRLKSCLRAAYQIQEHHKKKTGAYYRKASEMPVDQYCDGFLLAQNATKGGYEIMAQFHENENTVRWTINQDGVIEEHLDAEYDDDLEL